LGVRLTVLSVADDYVDVIRNPSCGYGKAMNPCVDCRIYMAKMARGFMEQIGGCVVVTGEILGQRPMSQKRRDLAVIERQSGLDGRLLRPLSAKLLPPTLPELEGLIDRERLYDFSGRGRRPLIDLARRLGIRVIPQPSTGCALTETSFAPRVRDLIELQPDAKRRDFELLNVGRHIRIDSQTKIVVGRNQQENAWLERFFERENSEGMVLVSPENFVGPVAVITGQGAGQAVEQAGSILVRYTRQVDRSDATVQVRQPGAAIRAIRARPLESADSLRPL
jgi:tRNA U34 2-thiouridine synthase MnmA/TrmU